jgi:hypothetical protein
MTLDEIRTHFGMKWSAISQLRRRFKEATKGDKELGGILGKITEEVLLNAEPNYFLTLNGEHSKRKDIS